MKKKSSEGKKPVNDTLSKYQLKRFVKKPFAADIKSTTNNKLAPEERELK